MLPVKPMKFTVALNTSFCDCARFSVSFLFLHTLNIPLFVIGVVVFILLAAMHQLVNIVNVHWK